MDPMLDAFEQMARQIRYEALRIPMISNLTSRMRNIGETLDAHYWRRQTRETVQFAAGMHTLAEYGCGVFLELGPTSTLLNMGKRSLPEETGIWLASLQKDQQDWEALLHSVGTLYVKGINLDWFGFDSDYIRHRLSLPTYPFERERYWLETKEEDKAPKTPTPKLPAHKASRELLRHPLLDSHTELVSPSRVHVWETELDRQYLPYLNDHRIQGVMAVPVSVYIEMAQAATREALGPGPYVLTELELKKLLFVPEQGTQKIQVVLAPDAQQVSFHVYSHAAGVPEQPRNLWTLHATGKILHD
jgi:acyl transferase domain-containing protein